LLYLNIFLKNQRWLSMANIKRSKPVRAVKSAARKVGRAVKGAARATAGAVNRMAGKRSSTRRSSSSRKR
jgi:hypothetical protein